MVEIFLISHEDVSVSLLQSAELILGTQKNVYTYSLKSQPHCKSKTPQHPRFCRSEEDRCCVETRSLFYHLLRQDDVPHEAGRRLYLPQSDGR